MKSWYDIALDNETLLIASNNDKILKEAGIADYFKSAPAWIAVIATAIVMGIHNGLSEKDAKQQVIEKNNLSPEQVLELDSYIDPVISRIFGVNKQIKQTQPIQLTQPTHSNPIQQKQAKIPIDEFIQLIINHEGVTGNQTPFRITNPDMKRWHTILGFPIYKGPVPFFRKNFIHLKNPSDVKKAVKQQFIEYHENPSAYNLPPNPTLKDAIKKFDQSGTANDKIAYIKKHLPAFNENSSLSSIF